MPPPSEHLARILQDPRETRSIEFKRAMSWHDDHTKAKVICATMALANHKDGGTLIFGLEQIQGSSNFALAGLTANQSRSFELDAVAAKVNAHCSPFVTMSVEHAEQDGHRIVAISVEQFRDSPIICTNDVHVNGVVKVIGGRIYCRSGRMPESTVAQKPEDLRDIIQLAVARGLQSYFELRGIERRASGPTADDQFSRQASDLFPS